MEQRACWCPPGGTNDRKKGEDAVAANLEEMIGVPDRPRNERGDGWRRSIQEGDVTPSSRLSGYGRPGLVGLQANSGLPAEASSNLDSGDAVAVWVIQTTIQYMARLERMPCGS
jgi:hypothetical protein